MHRWSKYRYGGKWAHHEGQSEIRHPGKPHTSFNDPLDLCKYCCPCSVNKVTGITVHLTAFPTNCFILLFFSSTWFIENCINFFDHIKICLIVCVLDTSPSPWNIRQLTCWQSVSNIATSWKKQMKCNVNAALQCDLKSQKFTMFLLTFVYLLVYWRLTAECWEALSSPWGHWTRWRAEIRCRASPPIARKQSLHYPWLQFLNILQSNPAKKKKKCYWKDNSGCPFEQRQQTNMGNNVSSVFY